MEGMGRRWRVREPGGLAVPGGIELGPVITAEADQGDARTGDEPAGAIGRAFGPWRQLHTRLHAPDVARQRALAGRRAQLTNDRQAVAEQLDRVERRLETAVGGLRRLRNRQLLAQLRADHHAYTGRLDRLDRLDHQLHDIDTELAVLPSDRHIAELADQHRKLASQLHWAASRRIAGYRDTCPDHLTTALGPPPADARGRNRWEQAASAIENYRLHWQVTDPHRALGPEPTDPLQHEGQLHATRTIEQARRDLSREPVHHRSRTRGLTRGL
jgi:hypothetical protein